MSDLRKRISVKFPRTSAGGLKIFSMIIVLIVNINTIVLEKGILRLDDYSPTELVAAMNESSQLTTLVGVASIIRLFAGLAVPIFAFLLVEGFVHTGHYTKYLGAMTATALVSELAYDFAMTGSVLEFSQQNPMFAMVIGLVMLSIMKMLENKAAVERVIGRLLIILCAVFWVFLLRTEYGLETVILVAIFYCFRERMAIKTLLGVLVSLMDPLGPFAFCGLIYYNGKRNLKSHKYVYYVFYPLHLLVLGIIARFFLI